MLKSELQNNPLTAKSKLKGRCKRSNFKRTKSQESITDKGRQAKLTLKSVARGF